MLFFLHAQHLYLRMEPKIIAGVEDLEFTNIRLRGNKTIKYIVDTRLKFL